MNDEGCRPRLLFHDGIGKLQFVFAEYRLTQHLHGGCPKHSSLLEISVRDGKRVPCKVFGRQDVEI